MKKVLGVLVALLLVSSAMGAVNLTITQPDTSVRWAEISYNAAAEPNLPRAFALKIEVDAGKINVVQFSMGTDGNACPGGSCEPFDIYPGNIVIDEEGNVTSYGSPVAPPGAPDNPPPLDDPAGYIIVEMGSLYSDPGNAPLPSGLLLRVHCTADCTMTVSEELDVRGGVVLEDPDIDPTVNGDTQAIMIECFYEGLVITCNGALGGNVQDAAAVTQAQYDAWVAQGRPPIWCEPCFGCGDTDASCDLQYGTDIQRLKDVWAGVGYSVDTDFSRDGLLQYGTDIARIKEAWNNPTPNGKCPTPCPPN